MINYQFFPRSRGVTPEIKAIIDCFCAADKKIPKGRHLVSNESFYADALSSDNRIVIEVESGRAVDNNQFLKDIFQASMMFEVEYLVIAVLNEYVRKKHRGEPSIQHDYLTIKTFLETMYVSTRLQLPLKGILLLGY